MMALSGTPAAAGWRDFVGKTLVVETEMTSRSETDTITARGGASAEDTIDNSHCRFEYRVYVSSKQRLFLFTTRWQCNDGDEISRDTVDGTIYDLSGSSGVSDPGPSWTGTPYTVTEEGDELILQQPAANLVNTSNGAVTTITNALGGNQMRFRFTGDCGMSFSDEESYRMEYRSTDSDYYALQDTRSKSTTESTACRVVDGFQAK
jgi:hypothetical protein